MESYAELVEQWHLTGNIETGKKACFISMVSSRSQEESESILRQIITSNKSSSKTLVQELIKDIKNSENPMNFYKKLKCALSSLDDFKRESFLVTLNIAVHYKHLENLQKAKKYFKMTKTKLDQAKRIEKIDFYIEFASLYCLLGFYKKANKIALRNIRFAEEEYKKDSKKAESLARAYISAGDTLKKFKKYSASIIWFDKCIQFAANIKELSSLKAYCLKERNKMLRSTEEKSWGMRYSKLKDTFQLRFPIIEKPKTFDEFSGALQKDTEAKSLKLLPYLQIENFKKLLNEQSKKSIKVRDKSAPNISQRSAYSSINDKINKKSYRSSEKLPAIDEEKLNRSIANSRLESVLDARMNKSYNYARVQSIKEDDIDLNQSLDKMKSSKILNTFLRIPQINFMDKKPANEEIYMLGEKITIRKETTVKSTEDHLMNSEKKEKYESETGNFDVFAEQIAGNTENNSLNPKNKDESNKEKTENPDHNLGHYINSEFLPDTNKKELRDSRERTPDQIDDKSYPRKLDSVSETNKVKTNNPGKLISSKSTTDKQLTNKSDRNQFPHSEKNNSNKNSLDKTDKKATSKTDTNKPMHLNKQTTDKTSSAKPNKNIANNLVMNKNKNIAIHGKAQTTNAAVPDKKSPENLPKSSFDINRKLPLATDKFSQTDRDKKSPQNIDRNIHDQNSAKKLNPKQYTTPEKSKSRGIQTSFNTKLEKSTPMTAEKRAPMHVSEKIIPVYNPEKIMPKRLDLRNFDESYKTHSNNLNKNKTDRPSQKHSTTSEKESLTLSQNKREPYTVSKLAAMMAKRGLFVPIQPENVIERCEIRFNSALIQISLISEGQINVLKLKNTKNKTNQSISVTKEHSIYDLCTGLVDRNSGFVIDYALVDKSKLFLQSFGFSKLHFKRDQLISNQFCLLAVYSSDRAYIYQVLSFPSEIYYLAVEKTDENDIYGIAQHLELIENQLVAVKSRENERIYHLNLKGYFVTIEESDRYFQVKAVDTSQTEEIRSSFRKYEMSSLLKTLDIVKVQNGNSYIIH